MTLDFSKNPLRFLPNLRTASAGARTGYVWGKPVSKSNILKTVSPETSEKFALQPEDVIAERWIVSDDRKYPSFVQNQDLAVSFSELLADCGLALLGAAHLKEFGPYLKTMMKLLDTHEEPGTGSLSVQVHPAAGHSRRPAKLEMWRGRGRIYLGWKQEMTPALIAESSVAGTLENYLNAVSLNDECVGVPGGIVHAIRYDSYLSEWSEAPGMEDCNKGNNIQDSTVALYDRTDGKTARPGKEDLPGTLDLLTHAKTFGEFNADPRQAECSEKNSRFEHWILFRTKAVKVDEWRIFDSFSPNLENRGFPVYVEKGSGEIWVENQKVGVVKSGEELFFPAAMKQVTFKAFSSPLVIQTWQVPLSSPQNGKA